MAVPALLDEPFNYWPNLDYTKVAIIGNSDLAWSTALDAQYAASYGIPAANIHNVSFGTNFTTCSLYAVVADLNTFMADLEAFAVAGQYQAILFGFGVPRYITTKVIDIATGNYTGASLDIPTWMLLKYLHTMDFVKDLYPPTTTSWTWGSWFDGGPAQEYHVVIKVLDGGYIGVAPSPLIGTPEGGDVSLYTDAQAFFSARAWFGRDTWDSIDSRPALAWTPTPYYSAYDPTGAAGSTTVLLYDKQVGLWWRAKSGKQCVTLTGSLGSAVTYPYTKNYLDDTVYNSFSDAQKQTKQAELAARIIANIPVWRTQTLAAVKAKQIHCSVNKYSATGDEYADFLAAMYAIALPAWGLNNRTFHMHWASGGGAITPTAYMNSLNINEANASYAFADVKAGTPAIPMHYLFGWTGNGETAPDPDLRRPEAQTRFKMLQGAAHDLMGPSNGCLEQDWNAFLTDDGYSSLRGFGMSIHWGGEPTWERCLWPAVAGMTMMDSNQYGSFASPYRMDTTGNASGDPLFSPFRYAETPASTASSVPSNYLICDRTGFKVSVAEGLHKEWTGRMVRRESWEPRHPQDFYRARSPERQKGSPRPEPEDQFLGTNDVKPEDL